MEAAMREGPADAIAAPLQPDMATIDTFLAMLASDAGQIHLVAIHSEGQRPIAGRDFCQDPKAARRFVVEQNESGSNIYWTVNRVRDGVNKKPTKADITAARFAHVDIDPPKDDSAAFDKESEIALLEAMPCPPSFIIDSGGGLQAFWRLDGSQERLDDLEALNCAIRAACGGDNCQNIDRIMRLPGTVNWLDARKRKRGRKPVLSSIVRGWGHADV
jgi:hypothetical protein